MTKGNRMAGGYWGGGERMWQRWVRSGGGLLLGMACVATMGAQQGLGPAASTMTVTTRLVVLDVVVTDRKGRLVERTLAKDDFEVREEGVAQTLRSFETPAEHAMPAGVDGTAVVQSAADLAKIGQAPVTVLVLDELNAKFEDASYSRQMLAKYLQAQPAVLVQPTVLMVAENTSFTQLHDYTQDRDALMAALKRHMPQNPWRLENGGHTGAGAVERMAQVLAALDQVAQASQGTPGRKNLVWVGNGFSPANLGGLPADEGATIEAAVRRCTSRMLAARITMYTVNATADQSSTVAVDSVDDLSQIGDDAGRDPFGQGTVGFAQFAPATGGLSFAGRNDLNNVIGESIAEGQRYYTMSYVPSDAEGQPKSEDAAKFRAIRVVMRDPALRAMTREGYFAETAADLNPVLDSSMSARQVAANLKLDLSSALTGSMSYNGLAVTATKEGEGYRLQVAETGLGWSGPDAQGRQQAEATVAAGWYDGKGKLLGHAAREEVSARGVVGAGVTYRLAVTLPPGVARVRFVVRDARNGRMGTVDVGGPPIR